VIKTINNDKNGTGVGKWQNLDLVKAKLSLLLDELIDHHGFGEIKVDVRILKDGRKEVILDFGKHYRFVLTKQ
jgi:hypothetical protein